MSRRARRGRGAASAGSSSYSAKVGVGPSGRWPISVSRRAAPLSAAHQAVGQLDDLRRRAVVALAAGRPSPSGTGGGSRAGARRCAGEGVDRLVRIADDAQVVAIAQPGIEQPLLQRGDVLVLVDDEMAVARPHLLGDVRDRSRSHRPSPAADRRSRAARPAIWPARTPCRPRRPCPAWCGVCRPAAAAWPGSPRARPARPWPSRSRRRGHGARRDRPAAAARAAALATSRIGWSTTSGIAPPRTRGAK